MKFACFGYVDETKWNALPESEREAIVAECFAYDDELLKNGHWVDGGQALRSSSTAKTLRLKNGKVFVTDGPYAETKEQLGGVGVLEARDMNHAVELMSKHPGVRLGGPFEIRPIDEPTTDHHNATIAAPDAQRTGMTIVCLGYGNEKKWSAMSGSEREAVVNECMAYAEALRPDARWVGGEALQSTDTAKTLRFQGGRVLVTDGPFAETKEQLGGLAIFEFRDMNHAIEAWSKHPCFRIYDVLEIRPADEEFNAQWEARQRQNQALLNV
jgi:hypothetical protein